MPPYGEGHKRGGASMECIGMICTVTGAAALAAGFVRLITWLDKPHGRR